MKITRREKVMLIVLLIVAILAGGYYLVYSPLSLQQDQLVQFRLDAQIKVDEIEVQLAEGDTIQKQIDQRLLTIDQTAARFYPSIIQEKLFITLDELIAGSGLRVSSVTLSNQTGMGIDAQLQDQASGQIVETETADSSTSTADSSTSTVVAGSMQEAVEQYAKMTQSADPTDTVSSQLTIDQLDPALLSSALAQVESLLMTVQFNGIYDQVRQMVSMIESSNRSIQISNLTYAESTQDLLPSTQLPDQTTTTPDGQPTEGTSATSVETVESSDRYIQGSFIINFYAVPKINVQDDQYLNWP